MATNYTKSNGDRGIGVNKIQGYLNIFQNRGLINNRVTQDGIFGANTKTAVQQYQRYAGLNADGVVGELTWDSMFDTLNDLNVNPNIPSASRSFYLTLNSRGIDVYKLQEYLNVISQTNACLKPINADGFYGNNTKNAVMQFQYLNDLTMDGIVGAITWDTIVRKYLQTR